MISLSFALHLPLSEINQWQEQDLEIYADFVRRNGLPQDRIEHLLAQIAFIQATVAGVKKANINDFKIQAVHTTVINEKPHQKGSFLGFTGALPRKPRKRK